MEVILIVGALIFIGLAFGSAMIASRKGRSGFGWFLLTLEQIQFIPVHSRPQ
jgi:hypothetical protein